MCIFKLIDLRIVIFDHKKSILIFDIKRLHFDHKYIFRCASNFVFFEIDVVFFDQMSFYDEFMNVQRNFCCFACKKSTLICSLNEKIKY